MFFFADELIIHKDSPQQIFMEWRILNMDEQITEQTTPEQNIYIGANIPSLGLMRNQVYLGGIPGQVRAAINAEPLIAELIVPISKLTEAVKDIQTKGTHLHHVYKELQRKAGKA